MSKRRRVRRHCAQNPSTAARQSQNPLSPSISSDPQPPLGHSGSLTFYQPTALPLGEGSARRRKSARRPRKLFSVLCPERFPDKGPGPPPGAQGGRSRFHST